MSQSDLGVQWRTKPEPKKRPVCACGEFLFGSPGLCFECSSIEHKEFMDVCAKYKEEKEQYRIQERGGLVKLVQDMSKDLREYRARGEIYVPVQDDRIVSLLRKAMELSRDFADAICNNRPSLGLERDLDKIEDEYRSMIERGIINIEQKQS